VSAVTSSHPHDYFAAGAARCSAAPEVSGVDAVVLQRGDEDLHPGRRFAAFVVCRRYWSLNLRTVRKLATEQGGEYVGGIHFSFAGGQVRSLLSLLSYFGKGEDRERYLGVKIPATNLKPDYREQTRAFASQLADGLMGAGERAPAAA
jgi:hypothetical protein